MSLLPLGNRCIFRIVFIVWNKHGFLAKLSGNTLVIFFIPSVNLNSALKGDTTMNKRLLIAIFALVLIIGLITVVACDESVDPSGSNSGTSGSGTIIPSGSPSDNTEPSGTDRPDDPVTPDDSCVHEPNHEATCTEDSVCTKCGDTIEKAHHNYENCVCTVCGDKTLEHDILIIMREGTEYAVTGVKSKSFTEVTVPNFVTIIDDEAFEDCTMLEGITFLGDITRVGWGALEDTAWYGNQPDGIVYVGKVAYKYKGAASQGTVTIKDGTVSIAPGAFYECDDLTDIVIPEGVKSIGRQAFDECDKLCSVNIPDSVEIIDRHAFYYCRGLTEVTMGSGVKSIGKYAFYECSALTEITIKSNVENIGEKAFYGCGELSKIVIDSAQIAELNSSDCNLLDNASTVYLKTGLTAGNYISDKFSSTSSDKAGYEKYTLR